MAEWNDKTESIVNAMGETCKLRRKLHLQNSDDSRKMHTILSTASMIVGPIAAVISGQNIGECNNNTVVVSLSVVSGILASVIKFGKFDEMHHLHKQASSSYHMIETNINLQLAREPEDRERPDIYINWLQSKYEEIFTAAPHISIYEVGKSVIPSDKDDSASSFDLEIGSGREYMENIVKYEMSRFETTS